MKDKRIQNHLNELWGGDITKFDIDILKQTISLVVELINKGEKKVYLLQFRGVVSFYFVIDNGHRRHEPDKYFEGFRLELSSINTIHDIDSIRILSKSDPKWAEQYFSNSNILLELWSSILLIEANEVLINSELFVIEYPS